MLPDGLHRSNIIITETQRQRSNQESYPALQFEYLRQDSVRQKEEKLLGGSSKDSQPAAMATYQAMGLQVHKPTTRSRHILQLVYAFSERSDWLKMRTHHQEHHPRLRQEGKCICLADWSAVLVQSQPWTLSPFPSSSCGSPKNK